MPDSYWSFPDAPNMFNRARHPSLPELHPTTCLILEAAWSDDYESFGLCNASDDPVLYAIVMELDRLVRQDGPPSCIAHFTKTLNAHLSEDMDD